MCLNPKVVVALAAAGVAVYAFAPGAFAAAWPLLVLAVCPLSMVLMMAMMSGGRRQEQPPHDRSDADLRAELAQLEARQSALRDRLESRDEATRS